MRLIQRFRWIGDGGGHIHMGECRASDDERWIHAVAATRRSPDVSARDPNESSYYARN